MSRSEQAAGALESTGEGQLRERAVALVREYGRRYEAGERAPLVARDDLTATEVAAFCSQLMEAAEISPFELAMWSSWNA